MLMMLKWWLYTANSTNKAHKALILACWLKINRQKMVSVWALSEWNHFFSQIIPIKRCCKTQIIMPWAVSWRHHGLYKVLMRSCLLRKIWTHGLQGLFPTHKSGIYCPKSWRKKGRFHVSLGWKYVNGFGLKCPNLFLFFPGWWFWLVFPSIVGKYVKVYSSGFWHANRERVWSIE